MGNTQGTKQHRRNKEEREVVKENRMNFISFRKNEINNIQTKIQSDAVKRIKNSANNEDGVMVLNEMNKKNTLLETTKKQLDREGTALTKADLIAIIIALDPAKFAANIDALNENTIADLNTMIRLIIYDPSRYVNTGSSVSTGTDTLKIKPNEKKKIKKDGEIRGPSNLFFSTAPTTLTIRN
jgi:hypothetical protein